MNPGSLGIVQGYTMYLYAPENQQPTQSTTKRRKKKDLLCSCYISDLLHLSASTLSFLAGLRLSQVLLAALPAQAAAAGECRVATFRVGLRFVALGCRLPLPGRTRFGLDTLSS